MSKKDLIPLTFHHDVLVGNNSFHSKMNRTRDQKSEAQKRIEDHHSKNANLYFNFTDGGDLNFNGTPHNMSHLVYNGSIRQATSRIFWAELGDKTSILLALIFLSVYWRIDSAKEFMGFKRDEFSWLETMPMRILRTLTFGTVGMLIPAIVEERASNLYVY